jgi:GT2 family glycosyltransferase
MPTSRALGRAIATIPQQICIPSAALWKIRKKQFAKMGGLSTDYIYAYYEDAALGLDALAEGVRVTIDTSARWIHMEGVGKSMPPMCAASCGSTVPASPRNMRVRRMSSIL